MPNSDEIGKLIAESLARNQQHAAHAEGSEMWEWMATFLLRDLHAAGYEIVQRKCNHSGYRGWEIDGRGCPDCGNIVVDPGD